MLHGHSPVGIIPIKTLVIYGQNQSEDMDTEPAGLSLPEQVPDGQMDAQLDGLGGANQGDLPAVEPAYTSKSLTMSKRGPVAAKQAKESKPCRSEAPANGIGVWTEAARLDFDHGGICLNSKILNAIMGQEDALQARR